VGEAKPTTGNVTGPKEAVIAYLPQHLLTQDKVTVFEETMKAFAEANQMQKELDEVNEQLTIRTDYDSNGYMKLIERISNIVGKHVSFPNLASY
jgi:ATP-binding cassette subfamily F protein 3